MSGQKIVVYYSFNVEFNVPKEITLNKNDENWWVKWNTLNIETEDKSYEIEPNKNWEAPFERIMTDCDYGTVELLDTEEEDEDEDKDKDMGCHLCLEQFYKGKEECRGCGFDLNSFNKEENEDTLSGQKVVAYYSFEVIFEVPKEITLNEDGKNWWVKGNILFIKKDNNEIIEIEPANDWQYGMKRPSMIAKLVNEGDDMSDFEEYY